MSIPRISAESSGVQKVVTSLGEEVVLGAGKSLSGVNTTEDHYRGVI